MAVPNTTTFTLANVCDEIGLTGSNRTLQSCINSAEARGYNSSYSGSKNSLLNFRDYETPSTADTLSISPTTYSNTSGFTDSFVVSVISNTSWTVSDNQTWITLSSSSGSGNGSITVNLSSNGTGSTRYGVVVFTTGDISRTVTVTQASNLA
ncbi:BACON domain-containing protein [Maribacter phage Colly_1]|uniref:BACON domain-containing protein n=1 Tax=Maribacter phage Colly_1 TaxID=2745691 RepID=A0A8E4UY46_9CAUD|nr:BACON domain-containing protein [Maribacter phage Colly_1]QQO97345.1 BACON domain-containing protein [Maribacter phage Colly_1]